MNAGEEGGGLRGGRCEEHRECAERQLLLAEAACNASSLERDDRHAIRDRAEGRVLYGARAGGGAREPRLTTVFSIFPKNGALVSWSPM